MDVFTNPKFAGPLAALALSFSFATVAQAEPFEPAGLANAAEYLERAVTPPALTEDTPVASVYCSADVSAEGVTSEVICYERDGFDRLRDQTAAAMVGVTLTPAKVDGAPVPVRMYFRAVYSNLEGQPPLLLLPNLGNMQSQFGVDYSAPQERLDKHQWFATYQANQWADGERFFSDQGRLTRMVVIVSEEGEPITVRRIEASRSHKRDVVEMEKQLKKASFIPGFANGKPERMQYVAVLHYPQ